MIFEPLKPKKISTRIAEQIRTSILAGDFSPGDKLPPERELADMFGVSRTSVREALNILAESGLVMSYQGGGTVVKSLVETRSGNSLTNLIRKEQRRALDVIEVRKGMESWTAFYAAQRARPDDLHKLDEIIGGMKRNLEELKVSEDLDANFHLVIARATHNIIWQHLMQSIFDAMKEFQQSVWRATDLTPEDHHRLYTDHCRIIEAIRTKDAEGARAVMTEHLAFAEQHSNAYITRRTP